MEELPQCPNPGFSHMNRRLAELCCKFYNMKIGDVGDRPQLMAKGEKSELAQADLHGLDGAGRKVRKFTILQELDDERMKHGDLRSGSYHASTPPTPYFQTTSRLTAGFMGSVFR